MAETNRRKQTIQNISWFHDLRQRKKLNMNPPYQRWSVWNRNFQESFIDTILLGYPSPAIFLYREVEETGKTRYDVVDGKQRLTAIFEFIEGVFPVGQKTPLQPLKDKYFEDLSQDQKLAFWDYDLAVEYLPTNNAAVVDDIFERLNKNTARLTRQELRHAKYGGHFLSAAESLAIWTWGGVSGGLESLEDENDDEDEAEQFRPALPPFLPRISAQSRRQMKDVEVVATLLLFLEEGVKGYSADALDDAFDKREEWDKKDRIEGEYRRVIDKVAKLYEKDSEGFMHHSRLRNQADFYSFFGAIADLRRSKRHPEPTETLSRVAPFLKAVDEYDPSESCPEHVSDYYQAARSASNDPGPRSTRIRIMKEVILGKLTEHE